MTRIEKYRSLMKTDAAIFTDELSRFYLTGFAATDGTLLILKDSAVLFADFRYIEAARKEVIGAEVIMPEGSPTATIRERLTAAGAETLGFCERTVTVAQYEGMKAAYPEVELVPAESLIVGLREHKDAGELKTIADAQAIADRALAEFLKDFKPDGMTETDVALELEYRMRRLGASGVSFETIAVSGSASSKPHGVPENIPLRRGFLTMDFGCIYNHYCSDMTRTVVIGKADAEMKKVYSTVLAAQLAAIDAVAEGKRCADIDKVARDIIYGAGYTGCFGHGLGHGVGLQIHEAPSVSPRSASVLERGHVVTVEPGIYISGKYGVRIEDMMCMTDGGPVNITHSPKEMIEIY